MDMKKRQGASFIENENNVRSTAIFGGATKEINQKKHLYQKESNDLLKLSSSMNDSSGNNSDEESVKENKIEESNSSGSHTEELDDNEFLEMESVKLDIYTKNNPKEGSKANEKKQ